MVSAIALTSNSYPAQTTVSDSQPSFPALSTLDAVKRTALGVFGCTMTFVFDIVVVNRIINVMKSMSYDLSQPQEAFQLLRDVSSIPNKVISLVLKTALVSYISFFGPIIEEVVFRGFLYEKMRSWVENPEALCQRALRVIGNGLVFGAAHLSPFQGWFNVPVFVSTFFAGCVLAGMREMTGDILAPTVSHILHNSTVMALVLLGVEEI